MVRSTGYTLMLFFCLCAAAFSDIVVLKTGARMEGKIVAQDDDAITLHIKNAEIEIKRATIKEIIEQRTPRELYEKMLESLADDDADGHYHVALYCINESLKDDAVELLRRAVQLKPGFPEAEAKLKEIIEPAARETFDRAKSLAERGQPGKARECFARVAENYPETQFSGQARAAIADLYFSQKNYLAALNQWASILKDDDRNTRAYLGAMLISERIGQFEKTLQIIEGVLAYERDEHIRRQCIEKKQILTEIVAAGKTIEQQPEDPASYASMASHLDKLGLPESAIRWAEKAVEKGARGVPIVERLARHFDKEMKVVRALKYWTLLKELNPDGRLAREADQRIAQLSILKLVPEYLQTAAPGRRAEIARTVAESGLPFATIEAVARASFEFPPADKTGVITRTISLGDGTDGSCTLFVPEKYDPESRWPLVLALHPAGGTGQNYINAWTRFEQAHGYFVLAPTSPPARGEGHAGWDEQATRQIVNRALRDVRESFNIDPNRIYVDGASMGGIAAWHYGLATPDLFAGLVCRAGAVNPDSRFILANAFALPVYIIHGLKDTIIPLEAIKPVRDELVQMGYDVTYRLDTKAAHSSFIDETPKVIEWLSNRVRDPYPRQVRFRLTSLARPRSYWLQAEVLADTIYDPDKPVVIPKIAGKPLQGELRDNYIRSLMRTGVGKLDGQIEGNRISVSARHVMGYTVLLDDRLVDLDKPVQVITNGKQSFSGKVERDVQFMLEWARRYGDPEMIYSSHVRVVIGGE